MVRLEHQPSVVSMNKEAFEMRSYHGSRVLQKSSPIAFPFRARSRAQIDEVPTLRVPLTQYSLFRIMQKRDELSQEPFFRLFAQLIAQPPKPTPDDREPVIDFASGRQPILSAVISPFTLPPSFRTYQSATAS